MFRKEDDNIPAYLDELLKNPNKVKFLSDDIEHARCMSLLDGFVGEHWSKKLGRMQEEMRLYEQHKKAKDN